MFRLRDARATSMAGNNLAFFTAFMFFADSANDRLEAAIAAV